MCMCCRGAMREPDLALPKLDSKVPEAHLLRKSDIERVTTTGMPSTSSEKCHSTWNAFQRKEIKAKPWHKTKEPREAKEKKCALCRRNCLCKDPEAGEHGAFKEEKVHCSKVQRLRRTPNIQNECWFLVRPALEVRFSYSWFRHLYNSMLYCPFCHQQHQNSGQSYLTLTSSLF